MLSLLLAVLLPLFLTKQAVEKQINKCILFLLYQQRYLLGVESVIPTALGKCVTVNVIDTGVVVLQKISCEGKSSGNAFNGSRDVERDPHRYRFVYG